MNVDLSHLSGHILILGVPASQDGLLSLLAALRSKRLLQWRPVVIIDSAEPRGGGSWEAVAQFSDVYFIQVRAWAPAEAHGVNWVSITPELSSCRQLQLFLMSWKLHIERYLVWQPVGC